MPSDERRVRVLVSPRFRGLSGGVLLGELERVVPGIIITELAKQRFVEVMARPDVEGLLAETMERVAQRDYFEAQDGGSITVTQNVNLALSDEDRSELIGFLQENVTSRLRALGVDLFVYGRMFQLTPDQIRADMYLLDPAAALLQGAEGVLATPVDLARSLEQAASRLAAAVRAFLERAQGSQRRRTFAVLPFGCLADGQQYRRWREGLTEELITVLKNVRVLRLLERATTSRYRDHKDLDPLAAGRELGVELVLWGNYDVIEEAGQPLRIRIWARLVDVETGDSLQTFKQDGDLGYGTLTVLAKQIFDTLDVQPTSIREVEALPTQSTDALEYVHIGIHYLDEKNYPEALRAFQEALKLDPAYSDAHFHLASTYRLLRLYDKALAEYQAALGNAVDRGFGSLRWQFHGEWKVACKIVADEHSLYVGIESGVFHCIARADGTLRWAQHLEQGIGVAAILYGEHVYAATESELHQLDRADGRVLNTWPIGGEISQDLVSAGSFLLITTESRPADDDDEEEEQEPNVYNLSAFDPKTGEHCWGFGFTAELAAPVVGVDSVFMATADGAVQRVTLGEGTEVWSNEIDGQGTPALQLDAGVLYCALGDYACALSAETGAILWELRADESAQALSLDEQYAYVGFGSKVYAIRRSNGRLVWIHDSKQRIGTICTADGLIWVTSSVTILERGQHLVQALDRDSGQMYWRYRFGDRINAAPIILNGTLYTGNRDHDIYAFNVERAKVGLVRSAELWAEIGATHLERRDSDAALDALQRAVQLNPALVSAYERLYRVYREQRRTSRAIEVLQDYIDLLPDARRADAETELRQLSGLRWTRQTHSDLLLLILPLNQSPDLDSASPILPAPSVSGASVVQGTENGTIGCWDAETGEEKWTLKQEDVRGSRSTPTIEEDRVYIGYGEGLHCLELGTGEVRWTYQIGRPVDSKPACWQGNVYFGSDDSAVHALRAADGKLIWRFETGDRVKSSPAVLDGSVYIGSYDGWLYALDAADGSEQWRFRTSDVINSSPVVADDTVYLGPDDNSVYAIDRRTGEQRWSSEVASGTRSALLYGTVDESGLDTFGFLPSTPVVRDGRVYVGSNGSGPCYMFALDAETGRVIWRYKLPNSAEAGSGALCGNLLFVGSGAILFQGESLMALDVADGSLVWKYRTNGDVLSAPTVRGTEVYCTSMGGTLYRFDAGALKGLVAERDADFYAEAGQVAFDNNEFDAALAAFERARHLNPKHVNALVGLADCYERQSQVEKQRDTLENLQKLEPLAAQTYWRLGGLYQSLGNSEAAVQQFSAYTNLLAEAHRPVGLVMLARTHRLAGQLSAATAALDSAIELSRRHMAPKKGTEKDRENARGFLFMAAGEKAELLFDQEASLEEGLDLDLLDDAADMGTTLAYFRIRGLVALQKQEFGEAVYYFRQATEDVEDADMDSLHRLYALLQDHLFDFEAAYDVCARARAANANDPSHALNLAEVSICTGRYAESTELAAQVIQATQDPTQIWPARAFLALAALLRADQADARQHIDTIVKFRTDQPVDNLSFTFAGTRHYLTEVVQVDDGIRALALGIVDLLEARIQPADLMARV